MERPLGSIIAEAVQVAEAQLAAARTLNASGLMRATERRQDLQFELDFVEIQPELVDDDTRNNLLVLRNLDKRLSRLLEAGSRIFEHLRPLEPPPTYGRNGRLSSTRAGTQP